MSDTQVKRLHVSPLTPDLLSKVLGPDAIKAARNITYHSIQTFPDKAYAYVDLPDSEAEKVRKKLNGAILKGKKMKIEDARPKKRKHEDIGNDEHHELAPRTPASRPKRSQRSKEGRDLIEGHELPQDRKVNRGWTEQKRSSKKDKKDRTTSDRQTSKYTNKEELLFRTKLPENKANMKKKKSKKTKGSHTVHEFERSVAQPSFLKKDVADTPARNLEYVDGQGWADAAGNVIEKEPSNLRERRRIKKAQRSKHDTSDQNGPSVVNSDVHHIDEASDSARNPSSSAYSESGSSPTPQTPQEPAPLEPQQIHPLEALFKRPQKPASSQDVVKPSLEVQTTFSFFEGAPDEDLEEEPSIPGTPFSSQDVRSRVLRSAAPTPDTAHPSRFNSYGSVGLPGDEELESYDPAGDQDDGQDDREANVVAKTTLSKHSGPEQQQSDFAKMFWEKRGENNRSWKARRRTVLKEKRQRENRARRPKNW